MVSTGGSRWRGEYAEMCSSRIDDEFGGLGGGETPGLMLGLAGIGYFYLRLFDPDGVPPVLIVLP